MQYIAALLQEVVEKRKILKHVQLRRSWDLSFFEKGIELRARFGVAPHIVLILYPVYRIRIKQHGNVSLFRIGKRKINGRFARKCKRHHTMLLLLLCGKDAPCLPRDVLCILFCVGGINTCRPYPALRALLPAESEYLRRGSRS